MANSSKETILNIKDLRTHFTSEEGMVEALDGVNLEIKKGEIHGLVGETGCGKSVTSLTILGLLDNNARIKSGEIIYKGQDLLKMSQKELRKNIRGKEISMIFQDPSSSLNPVYTSGEQVREAVQLHRSKDTEIARQMVLDEFDKVKLPDPEDIYEKYPHQLSGGMKQRVMISMMLACNSDLIIADEPTTALDVSIQAQFLRVLKELQEELDLSMLYITHDMAVISEICDRVSVMYAGQIVESGTVHDIFKNPKHPYTRGLINSVPGIKQSIEEFSTIPGTVPRLIDPPTGCRFNPRCEYAKEKCENIKPETREIRENHTAACHYLEEVE